MDNNRNPEQKKKFNLNIDYDSLDREETLVPRRPTPPPARRPEPGPPARRDYPAPRTRVVTNRYGGRYEIADERPLRGREVKDFGRNNRSRGCMVAVVYAVIVCSISALLSYYLIVGINDMFGLVKSETEVTVELPKGADLNTVTKLLDEKGVVEYPFFFKLYASMANKRDYKDGTFVLNTKSDYDMIIRKLTHPAGADKNTVKALITEGRNVMEITDIMEYNMVFEDRANFDDVMQNYAFKHAFLNEGIIPATEGRIYRLEGYLFPATYTFYMGEGAKFGLNRLLNAFSTRIMEMDPNTGSPLPEQKLCIKERAAALGRTVDDIIIMASIIERESLCTDEHMEDAKNVAAVFYNRLKNPTYEGIGGKLQSDATLWYPYPTKKAMTESKTLTDKQKKDWLDNAYSPSMDDSPAPNYSTYARVGLPVGPICNPGYNAIYAACYPNLQNSYYYFIIDTEGKHYFASTYTQHQANINTAIAAGVWNP
ncbi:MAG: endolytic transglycosylase MltG [Oscillospiraceae bacterium]|nr:endolytic transglycosylase MltG [Oscillospiraceae bacterium]